MASEPIGTPLHKFPEPEYGDEPIPKERYTSPEFAAREWERMWTRTWQIAGPVSDLDKVGDYFSFEIGHESILVVRSGPAEISAFYKRSKTTARQVDLIEDTPEVRAALESLGGAFEDPENAFDRAEIGRLVQVALDQLPSHYGSALEWKYLEGLSVKQIAGKLKLSPKAVESLLTRAREAFRDGFRTLTRTPSRKVPRPVETS